MDVSGACFFARKPEVRSLASGKSRKSKNNAGKGNTEHCILFHGVSARIGGGGGASLNPKPFFALNRRVRARFLQVGAEITEPKTQFAAALVCEV